VLAECGIGVENAGHVKMCNASREVFMDNNNKPYRLDTSSIKEIYQSKTRKKILDDLANGVQTSNCESCWDSERSGVESIRQTMNNAIPQNPKTVAGQPSIVILKPGNQCNLACSYCNPETTWKLYKSDYILSDPPSKLPNTYEWYKEKFKYKTADNKPSYRQYISQFKSQRESFNKSNELWKDLEDWSPGIVHYALFGGEPFVMKPLFDLLNATADKGDAEHIGLYISTNGTVWSQKHIDTIMKYESVELGISIDALNKQFEYMRYPAKWEKVLSNFEKFIDLRAKSNSGKVKLKISGTANPYNVYYLDELKDFGKKYDVDVDIHLIQIPEHYDVRILPDKVKEAIIEKFKDRQDLQNVSTHLETTITNADKHCEDFVYYTKGLDKLRNLNFGNTFPEFQKILHESKIVI
jgi:MoaA/NifB/PqqE/SkfB family radical SAM enzyme